MKNFNNTEPQVIKDQKETKSLCLPSTCLKSTKKLLKISAKYDQQFPRKSGTGKQTDKHGEL